MPRKITALGAVAVLLLLATPSAAAQGYVPISGSGSTWSVNALDQWRRNVDSLYGMRVDFSPQGSSQGRADFKAQLVNFAVSEIEYGLTDNNVKDDPPRLGPNGTEGGFAYMPIVAGGTSFMYNLKIGNNRVTNLRLSGENIAKIFTKKITNWSDPAIKADNPGLTLPARPIVPVVRGDGSGTTAQFTKWLAARYAGIWDAWCGRANCGFTSNFPVKSGVIAQNQSTGVAQYVQQGSSEGAITYVEYSYAKNAHFPVAKVLNDKDYYVEPTEGSVAVALLDATIKQPDLTQDLSKVYGKGAATDPRAYPLSSYSYMIVPTRENTRTKAAQGRTLSDFAYYFLCEGQRQAVDLGYSPLPVNLVRESVKQVARIPGTTNKLSENNLGGCNNPTFDPADPNNGNKLARIAPNPQDCDRKGPVQCATGTGGARVDTPTSNNGRSNNGPGGAGPGGSGPAAANSGETPAGAAVDPDTGQAAEGGSNLASNVSAIPVQVELPSDQRSLLTIFAIALLAALVLGPPLASRLMSNRRNRP
jgi:phosphate transport system substrate-binding protein